MNILLNLSTRAKLLLSFGLMMALLGTVSMLAYHDTRHLRASQEALFNDDLSIAFDLMALRNAINRERVALLSLMVAEQPEQALLQQKLDREREDVLAILNKLGSHKAADAALVQNIDRLAQARREYAEVRDRLVMPAFKAGKRNEASAAILGPLQDKFQAFRESADNASKHQFTEAEARMHDSEQLVRNAQGTLIAANALAILAGLLLVFWLDRLIAAPLNQAAMAARQIATGDLAVSVPPAAGKDEVGQLLRSLNTMVQSLRQLMKETNTGITTISAAAGEILAGTTQVSAGAAETAAAVSETTATVEEVKQTALLASQKARTVSDAAQKAAQTADAGRKAIEQGIDGMQAIQEHMQSIAETIVRLSERSQAIAEITATVGGLAEQSNLLAVNAAIEAAKAGDEGKGFAVVAQEVKDLADQSRQATRQVRAVLNDIQKAIGAAVTSAEQGAKTVASGVEQTTEAGNAIRILAENISDAAQAAAQIAATSQQQLAGLDQVAIAMENIKQVSAENAAGSRQSESSAQNLNELGQKLRQMSERFKL